MAKKKNKLKNFIKKVAPMAIAGLGAAMLGNRRGATAANVDSGRGGDSASAMSRVLANTPGYQDDILRGGSGVKFMPNRNPKSIRVPGDRYSIFGSLGFKKGGRVGCGVAKKGFGKALKKGGK